MNKHSLFYKKIIVEIFTSAVNAYSLGSKDEILPVLGVDKNDFEFIYNLTSIEFNDLARILASAGVINVNFNIHKIIEVCRIVKKATERELQEFLNKQLEINDYQKQFQSEYVIKEIIKDIELSLTSSYLGCQFYQKAKNNFPIELLILISEIPFKSKSALIIALGASSVFKYSINKRKIRLALSAYKKMKKRKDNINFFVANYANKSMVKYFFSADSEVGDQALTGLRLRHRINMRNRSKKLTVRQKLDLFIAYKAECKKISVLTKDIEMGIYMKLQEKFKYGFDVIWSVVNDSLCSPTGLKNMKSHNLGE